MLDITTAEQSGWFVVKAAGRADAVTAQSLEDALQAAAGEHQKIALDLSGLAYISSAGLRSVLQGARAAQTNNAEYVVCSCTPPVLKVFEMSGMQNVLRILKGLPC
ncbi:MAG: STAS domain-containing protein [Bryobacteraceae bacterium]